MFRFQRRPRPNRTDDLTTFKDITMLTYEVAPESPYVTCEKYSVISGLPMGTIRQYIAEGRIIIKPKTKTKEKPLVNMVAMHEIAAREAMQVLG
ncbi:hypothetical protein VCC_003231 [Vibrio cholerae RC9]|nr:hypothetical protein VCD_002153 [Vibrio cholerae MJ-1236]EEO08867.1 hypothetical protein VCC_003231 [Vibrio cholerae RC9]EEO16973.1 hypothetical protein VCE_003477 [Vibrio cholerae B33]